MTATLSMAQTSVTSAPLQVEDFFEVVSANLRELQDVRVLVAGADQGEWRRTLHEINWETLASTYAQWHTTNMEWGAPRRTYTLVNDWRSTAKCNWPGHAHVQRPPLTASQYSFAKRMRQLAALPEHERPSTVAYDLALQLDAFATEVARSSHIAAPPTVVSYVEGGELLIEWNVRTAIVRHLECLIPRSGYGPYRVLASRETKLGKVLKFTEVPEASFVEVLDQLNRFLSGKSEHE